MSTRVASIVAEITADSSKFNAGIDEAKSKLDDFTSSTGEADKAGGDLKETFKDVGDASQQMSEQVQSASNEGKSSMLTLLESAQGVWGGMSAVAQGAVMGGVAIAAVGAIIVSQYVEGRKALIELVEAGKGQDFLTTSQLRNTETLIDAQKRLADLQKENKALQVASMGGVEKWWVEGQLAEADAKNLAYQAQARLNEALRDGSIQYGEYWSKMQSVNAAFHSNATLVTNANKILEEFGNTLGENADWATLLAERHLSLDGMITRIGNSFYKNGKLIAGNGAEIQALGSALNALNGMVAEYTTIHRVITIRGKGGGGTTAEDKMNQGVTSDGSIPSDIDLSDINAEVNYDTMTWTGTEWKPNRASGGPVLPGQAYTVGEQGPETLVMGNQGGNIIPNQGAGGMSDKDMKQLGRYVGDALAVKLMQLGVV